MNHEADASASFLEQDGAIVRGESTQASSYASEERHDNAELPPPIGEAAAFVARLFSGPDPHARVDPAPPPSIVLFEPAPDNFSLIPTARTSDWSPANDVESSIPGPLNIRKRLPLNAALWTTMLGLAIVIFGSGLAIGYGLLGRQSKSSGQPTFEADALGATHNTASPATPGGQASSPNSADELSRAPARNSPTPSEPTVFTQHSTVLADNAGTHNLQPSAVQEHGVESPRAPAMAETHPTSSVGLHKSVASIQPAATTHAPGISTATPGASDREVQEQAAAPSRSINHENPFPSIKAPDIARAATLPAVEVPGSMIESPGHLDPCALVHSVQPIYPREAKKLHMEGDVKLRLVVGIDGTVENVSLVSGLPLLAPAAMDAAREFRYKPALLNGQPIQTVQIVEMSFKLKN